MIRRHAVHAGAVLALACGVYANSLGHDFVLDDRWIVVRNPLVQSLEQLPRLLRSNYYAPNFEVGLYRPVATVSYALNHALSGLEPWSYHAVNVLLHGAVSVLVYALAVALGASRLAAAFAGAFFAVHAVHAEAVANVAGRPELLAALFFLLALVGHVRRERAPPDAPIPYAAILVAYGLALGSKENAITWLGVVLLHDVMLLERGRSPWRRLVGTLRSRAARAYAGYAIVTVGYVGLRVAVLGAGASAPPTPPVDNPLALLDFPWSVLNALQVAWRYVGLLLFPLHLSYDYSYAQIPLLRSLGDPRLWLVLALSVAGGLGLVASARRAPRVFFGLAFALVTFSVVSNLLIPIGTIMAERLVYLPSAGFCLAVAFAGERLVATPRASQRAGVAALAALLLVGHGARAVVRSADWRSKERLYLHDAEVSTRSAKALNNAGWILIDRELDVRRGVALLERALEIWPDDAEYLDSLGWGHHKLGNHAEARELLKRSLALDASGPTADERRAHLRAVERALAAPSP